MLIDLVSPRRSVVYDFSIRHVNATGDRYFYTAGGAPSNVAGYQVANNAFITALSFVNQRVLTGSILIYKGSTLIKTLWLNTQASKVETGLSISLAQGDVLKVKIGNGTYDYPVLSLVVIWNQ